MIRNDRKMKNKKNIYFLLPAVLLVWGLLGYRIFSSVNPTNKRQQTIATFNSFKPQLLQESETFIINTNYRDPFLGTFAQNKITKSKKVTNTISKKPTASFPSIIYKGLVSPNGKQQQVFLINIDEQQYFFKKYNTHNEVKLLRGSNKQVVLKFQGQQQTFQLIK